MDTPFTSPARPDPIQKDVARLPFTMLIEFTEALEARARRRAEIVLDSLGPLPTPTRPATSQVIGAGLGLLDSWYDESALPAAFGEVEPPHWPGPARSTARKIIARARRGQAYDSLGELVARHGEHFVLTSVSLAVAATILTHASQQGLPLLTAADALFSRRTMPAAGSEAMKETYGAWLAQRFEEDEDLAVQQELFASMLEIANAAGLNIEDPGDVFTLLDMIINLPDLDVLTTALTTLQWYAEFQHEHHPDQWDQVAREIAETIREVNPQMAIIEAALSQVEKVPEAEQVMAMRRTRIVEAIADLLQWIGDSRPVTARGNLRRSDIQAAAHLLGIHAVGVARLPRTYREPTGRLRGAVASDVVHAQSMSEVPLLGPWWQALASVQILEFSTTRVRPGPAAPDPLNLGLLQHFLAAFVMETLIQRSDTNARHNLRIVTEVISTIVQALDEHPSSHRDGPDHRPGSPIFMEVLELEHAGLITFDGHTIFIPPALRGVVALGTAMAIAYIDDVLDGR